LHTHAEKNISFGGLVRELFSHCNAPDFVNVSDSLATGYANGPHEYQTKTRTF
jgi:hypothetical protein